MRANAFVAVLICIAVFLAGCSADMNSTESDTDFKGAETTVQTNQNDTEQYTQDTEISDVINDTAFGDYGRLIFPVNSSYYSGDTLGELGLTWYTNIDPDKTVEIANYMKSHAENGDVIFYDIYTDDEKAADPAKEDTGLFFFKGNPGERFAVCNAGGGFACRCNARQFSPRFGIIQNGLQRLCLDLPPRRTNRLRGFSESNQLYI
mgnify:CR=1 FL=1